MMYYIETWVEGSSSTKIAINIYVVIFILDAMVNFDRFIQLNYHTY